MNPRLRRLVQYRQGPQLALRSTVDTEAKRDREDLEASDTLADLAMSGTSDAGNKRQETEPQTQPMVEYTEPPQQQPEEEASDPTAVPVPWESEFSNPYDFYGLLQALNPRVQRDILMLLNTAMQSGSTTRIQFVPMIGVNPDSSPAGAGGNFGKDQIWFYNGFNPGGSLYPRNEYQDGVAQVIDKIKTHVSVRVTGPRAEKEFIVVTLHLEDGQRVTKAWAESRIKPTAKNQTAPGPFLNPFSSSMQKKEQMPTLDSLEFELDRQGYTGDAAFTIKHTDAKGGVLNTAHNKFYLKLALKSNPAYYVITPKFNIYGRVADGGRAVPRPLPLGYDYVNRQMTTVVAPSSEAGPSQAPEPVVATLMPPSGAVAPDPQ